MTQSATPDIAAGRLRPDEIAANFEDIKPPLDRKKALIEKRKRHLMADTGDDNLVTLEEWLAYVEDPQPDTSSIPFRKFDLADLDENDQLTLEEFANVYPPAVKQNVLLKKFTGQDDNEDDVLTRDEWNPGGSGTP